MSRRWMTAIAIGALLFCAAAAPAAASAAQAVKSATAALKAGEFERAIQLYEQARQIMPQNAELAYNLGVAHYRKGDFQKAADAFKDATALSNDGSLRSRSIYNMGNAAYAQSLNALKNQSDPAQSNEQLQQATDLLKDALENYKRAITADPRDEDARANAELSHKFLKQLQELQQQMSQQQQQSQQNEGGQPNQQNQQQQQQQSQSPQDPEQQQTPPSPGQHSEESAQSQQDQQQSQQQSDSTAEQQPQPHEQEQLEGDIEPRNEQPPDDQGKHVQHPTVQSEKKAMSRQEAERLLQSVRDKEHKRRMDLLRREASRYAPAAKDW